MHRHLKAYFSILLFILILIIDSGLNAQDKYADSLENELHKSAADTNRVNILTSLAFHLRGSDSIKAKKLRDQAFILSEKLDYTRGKGWYYYLEGINLSHRNQFLPAVEAESKAIALGHQIKDYDLIGRAYNNIGLNHLRLEDDSNAMKAFITALSFINNAKDQIVKAALLLNIGKLYAKQRKFNDALATFDKSRAIYLAENNRSGLSLTYLEAARVHYAVKDYKKTIIHAKQSLKLAKEINYRRTIVNSLILLGSSYTNLDNLREGRKYLEESMRRGNLKNMHEERLFTYSSFSSLSQKEGNFRDAFLYKRSYTQLYDSVFNANRSRLILEYQEKFQTQAKEAENKLLRNQQLTVQNTFKRRNQTLYITAGLLLGFVVFSLLLYWGNRQIKRANHLLTEQKDQIQQQKDNVEQLNQIKDKLFSVIAHDLRSPFASMKSMLDMYEEGIISKEDLDFFFREIRKDIGFNSLLLDNLLIWAKSQLDGFKIDQKPVALDRLSDQVLYHYKKHLENKEITIDRDFPKGSIAHADYEMTNTVIRNLIGNAIKFTPKKGLITISCEIRADDLLVKITDSGIGIPEADQKKLFQDTFFTTQGLNKEKGTGLGLQICKEFVEKNNGRIWVESRPGIGSSFCFTLQKSAALPAGIMVNQEVADEAIKSSYKNSILENIDELNKQDRYELLSRASNETLWDSDIIKREISWNKALNTHFGHPEEKTSIEWWDEKIHPDDFEHVKRTVQTAFTEKRTTWECEYRFLCADGSYKCVLDRGLILYDDDGIPYRFIGVMQNVNDQKSALKEIQRLSIVATNVHNMVLISDADDKVVWVNDAFERYTDYSLEEITGLSPEKLLVGEKSDQKIIAYMEACVKNNMEASLEIINYTKSGQSYWAQVDKTPFIDPGTNEAGFISIHTVITDRKEHERIIAGKNKTLREIAQICSSDVKVPMSSILGMIRTLNEKEMDETEILNSVDQLNASAEELDLLIHEIHNQISKIEKESV